MFDEMEAPANIIGAEASSQSTKRSQFWKTRRIEIFKKQKYFSKRRRHFSLLEQEWSHDIARLEKEIAKIDKRVSLLSQMERLQGRVHDLNEERRYYRCELAYFCGLFYDVGTSLHGIRIIKVAQTTRCIKRRAPFS